MYPAEFCELCRICGSKTSVLMGLHIFEREGEMRQIIKKIKECLPIQVNTTDKLPKMVCEECVYKLDLLYEFREKSFKTECELNNLLKELDYVQIGQPTEMSVPIQVPTTITDAILVQCVNPPLALEPQEASSKLKQALMKSSSENLKCEPDIFIKIENALGVTSGQVVNANPMIDSDSRSEGSEIGTDSDDSSSADRDLHLQEGNMLNNEPVANGLNSDNRAIIQNNLPSCENKLTDLSETGEYVLPRADQQSQWFFCNICGKAYAKEDDFQAHYEFHWNKCLSCDIAFTCQEELATHKRDTHSKKNKPTIKIMEKSIKSMEVEKDKSNKKIDIKKDCKPGEMKACSECGKEYRTNYKLAEHMRKHTGEKPFKCTSCDKAFRSKIGLAQHEAKHTGHYDYTCNSCGKGFQCKSYLIVHQRVHSDEKPFPCTTCGRDFKTKQSLADHQNRHLGVKPYVCEICGRGFITKGLCKSHQRVHSGMDNRQYPCTVCHKLFVSKSYLVTHLRIHTGEKPFMCEVCGKGFLTRVDLKIHSTMHTGEKSFVCEVCGKAFARRDALRCHRRSHTGERPYRCDVCGQSFTQFSPMVIHKRLHTGERPYACDLCGKSFVSRSTMMSHRKKHTT